MVRQHVFETVSGFALLLLVLCTAGCGNQTIRDYAKLTSQTTADFDSKIRLYANSAADFDASRQASQRRVQAQNNFDSDNVVRQQSYWALAGDKNRPAMLKQIQIDSESSLAIQLRPVPSSAALTALKSPPELAEVAKDTDQLSRTPSMSDQVKEVIGYSSEVYDDLKKDKASKAAEKSLTQGVNKTPPSTRTAAPSM